MAGVTDFGTADNDQIYGGLAGDSLAGGAGDDALYGEDGNDTLDGGQGNDYLYGGDGADVYRFGKGSGQDSIDNWDSDLLGANPDQILLGAGIGPQDLELRRDNWDLLIQVVGSQDLLRVHGYFMQDATTGSAVERLTFADGSSWGIDQIKAKVLLGLADAQILTGYGGHERIDGGDGNDQIYGGVGNDSLNGGAADDQLGGEAGNDALEGGSGNDQVYGGAGNDTLDGGLGNDYLQGGDGADVYRFGNGSGQDSIDNWDSEVLGANPDQILLGAGIGPQDLELHREGSDLLIQLVGSQDLLRVQGYFTQDATSAAAVERLTFADGASWGIDQIKAKVLLGLTDAQRLTGYGAHELINGGDGNDSLDGGVGNDSLYGGAADDHLVGEAGNDALDGGSGNDYLSGGAGNDTLDGGLGNDYLQGGDGADVYRFGKGSGQDSLYNIDSNVLGTIADTILLGAGIGSSEVLLRRDGQDLLIQLMGSPDSLRVQSYFAQDATSTAAVENLTFADGTTWTINQIKAKVLTGTQVSDDLTGYATHDAINGGDGDDRIEGAIGNDSLMGALGSDWLLGGDGQDLLEGGADNDQLSGDAGNDTLDGGTGNDVLRGGDGADVYRFGLGSGLDTIDNYDSNVLGAVVDTIVLGAGITTDDVRLVRFQADLILELRNSPDRLTVQNYFMADATTPYVVEQLQFADGSLWRIAEVKSRVQEWASTTEILSASAINTYLADNQITRQQVSLHRQSDELVIQRLDSQQRLLLSGFFVQDAGTGAAVDLVFADGEVLTVAALKAQLLSGGSANDGLTGYASADRIHGGDGDDVLAGLAGNDSLDGEGSDDFLQGGEGQDLLDGGSGSDSLYGEAGDDQLLGGVGDDELEGGSGQDTLDGGSGNDSLQGGEGADLYRFGLGSGQDSIDNQDQDALGSNPDRVLFGAGITPADIRLLRDGDPYSYFAQDLLIQLNLSQDSLRISQYFAEDATTSSAVEYLEFADGSRWTIDQVKAQVLQPTDYDQQLIGYDTPDSIEGGEGHDRLYGHADSDTLQGDAGNDWLSGDDDDDLLLGGSGSDSLIGGSGNDTLDGGEGLDAWQGGDGADLYRFGLGSGQDSIDNQDQDALGSNPDRVLFGAGITPADVRLLRDGPNPYFAQDLLIQLNLSQDSLRIANYFAEDATTSSAVEYLEFADGSLWTIDQVKAQVLAATADNQQLVGYDTPDSIEGGEGNDSLYGHADNDTLKGGADNDWLYGDDDDDLLLGGSGSDSLMGGSGNDTLDGGASHDSLQGGDGADLYRFGLGSGQDSIDNQDQDVLGSNPDRVLFGAGITPADIRLLRDGPYPYGSQDLLIQLNLSQDSLRISQYFAEDATTTSAVEYLEFADGSLWTIEQVKERVLDATDYNQQLIGYDTPDSIEGGEGNDSLYGHADSDTLLGGEGQDWLYGDDDDDWLLGGNGRDNLSGGSGNDTLDGGEGQDLLQGGEGADLYRFGLGSGQDSIDNWDRDALGSNPDRVLFGAGISSANVHLRQDLSSQDLLIQLNLSQDSLRISQYFAQDATTSSAVEYLEFADGSLWTIEQVKARLASPDQELVGSSASDQLLGGSGNDSLRGLAGDDRLQGEAGDDLLEGGAGHDQLYGGDGQDQLSDRLGFNALYGGAGQDRLSGRGLFEGGQGDDWLTATNRLSADTYLFNRGDGHDSLLDRGVAHNPRGVLGRTDDVLIFGTGISAEQLWFERQGDDLDVRLIGTQDAVLIKNWYLGAEYRIEHLATQDGRTLLDSQVDALVSAMAAFEPPAAGQTSLAPEYQSALNPVIAANWR